MGEYAGVTNTSSPSVQSTKTKKWPLTPAQADFAKAISAYRREHKVGPAYEDLMGILGLSKVVVADRVTKLVSRAFLRKGPGKFRNLYVTTAGYKAIAAIDAAEKGTK